MRGAAQKVSLPSGQLSAGAASRSSRSSSVLRHDPLPGGAVSHPPGKAGRGRQGRLHSNSSCSSDSSVDSNDRSSCSSKLGLVACAAKSPALAREPELEAEAAAAAETTASVWHWNSMLNSGAAQKVPWLSGQLSEAAPSSRSSCSSSGLRPPRNGSLATADKAEAAATTVNCHNATERIEVQCTANPDAVFPDIEPNIVSRGVHGQHDGSSRVIHLSRGRCPSLCERSIRWMGRDTMDASCSSV